MARTPALATVRLAYLVFALDEFWEIHESIFDLYNLAYPFLTILLVAGLLALQGQQTGQQRRALRWALCGMLLSVAGAFFLDEWHHSCAAHFGLANSLCIDLRSAEEILEKLGTLFVLLSLLSYTRARLSVKFQPATFRLYLIFLAAQLPPGPYRLFTGLYHSGDLERLSLQDEGGAPVTDSILPIGRLHIQASE